MYPSIGGGSTSTATTLPPWEPVSLSPQHVEMLKQHVQGIPISKIVYNFKRFGVKYSYRQIQRVIHSQHGQEFASFYSAHFHAGAVGLVEHGREHSPEAVYTELSIMRNPYSGDRHRLGAAQDMLDRFGPPKISRQETENRQPTTIVINLLPSQLSQFLTPQPEIEAELVLLPEPQSSQTDD